MAICLTKDSYKKSEVLGHIMDLIVKTRKIALLFSVGLSMKKAPEKRCEGSSQHISEVIYLGSTSKKLVKLEVLQGHCWAGYSCGHQSLLPEHAQYYSIGRVQVTIFIYQLIEFTEGYSQRKDSAFLSCLTEHLHVCSRLYMLLFFGGRDRSWACPCQVSPLPVHYIHLLQACFCLNHTLKMQLLLIFY